MPIPDDETKQEHEGADEASDDAIVRAADETQGSLYTVAPVGTPTQLGSQRFVFATYFAAGIGVAFLGSKVFHAIWLKLASWKPNFGEPHDEVLMPMSGLLGAGVAYYYWRRTRARELAEEVAGELAKVTWPGKTEVTNSTVIVIVATLFATVFFLLMDRFWGYVTNLVYGT
jgi:preprotein translocase subunit SecE